MALNPDGSTNKRAVYIAGLGVIDDYMASDDLNECVDALLQKRSKEWKNSFQEEFLQTRVE